MLSTNALKRMSQQESESLWESGEVANRQESLFLIRWGNNPSFFFLFILLLLKERVLLFLHRTSANICFVKQKVKRRIKKKFKLQVFFVVC